MLNRRHLRIKGLQALYAYYQAESKNVVVFEKSLLSTIYKVQEFYIYLLLLFIELSAFESADVQERLAKFIPTTDDLNAKPSLKENSFIQSLNTNKEFNELVKKYKLSWKNEYDLLRELLNKLKASPEYKHYVSLPVKTIKEDQEYLLFICKQLVFLSPLFEQHLEEKSINWPVDKEIVEGMILKTIKNFKKNSGEHIELIPITANWEEDQLFILDLFRKTIVNDKEYSKFIADKTQNWEVDRIALIDIILMKMAITEMLHFSSIPIKVTMNEYIDISKEFSTPKSKIFINGVLDKILFDLKKKNKIVKIGRGLLE